MRVDTLDRLTADDRLLLWSDRVWPQDVGLVAILDGGSLLDPDGRFRIEDAQEAVARRLHALPRLRQVLRVPRRGLGWPLWVDATSFELSRHVRVASLPAGSGDTELLQSVEDLRSHRLDPTRPLWEMWLLPGLADERVGLFIRMHHVVADGIAGIASLASLLDGAPDAGALPVVPWTPRREPSEGELFVENLQGRADDLGRTVSALAHSARSVRRARATWPAVRELLGGHPAPSTSLDGLVGPHRQLGLTRASMADVRSVADAHDATVNDVLLAMITGGVRSLLASRGERVDDLVLPIYVPMSLRGPERGAEMGNRITQLIVPLPVGLADPVERLHRITAATAERKASARPALGVMFRSKLLGGIMLKRIVRQRVNLLSADLPGPTTPLHFAGAEVLEAFPLLNLLGNMTLGVGALSYASRFNLLAVGDADIYPDIALFCAGMSEELRTLVSGRLFA